ncbi:acetolactate synthase large subunit [Amycolatopsis ultiminotia]|uniref:Acetolactate synthase large subunit n=1 Tax=Amycolatopsis ultiminotia TaxID=543629 RepID=A0ABP6W3E6_9PSEU
MAVTPTETAADAIVRALGEVRAEHVFTIPGGAVTPLLFAAESAGLRVVLAKHETGAAFMAMGYAQAGHRLGVCAVTSGPGATNAVTGVAAAWHDCAPVLVLTGQVAVGQFGRGAFQDSSPGGPLDVVGLYRHLTKRSELVMTPDEAGPTTRDLVREALAGRPGPVHLSVPNNVAIASCPVVSRVDGAAVPPTVDQAAMSTVARILATARRPAILAGHGVYVADACAALRAVAEQFRVPVATTPKGKGVFPEDHPLSLGVFGFGGDAPAESYLLGANVDVLVVVGSSLGEFQTGGYAPALGAGRTVVQIDIDATVLGRAYRTDIAVTADARAALESLASIGGDVAPPRDYEPLPVAVRGDADRMEGLLSPRAAVETVCEALSPDTLLFVDIGNCMGLASECHRVRETGTYFVGLGLGSMGYAGPASIGAKLARPDRPVVALLGDGAFAMTGAEIHTAVDNDIPVIWVVLNNGGHGMVHAGEVIVFGESKPWNLFGQSIDVGSVAAGLGAVARTVKSVDDLRAAVEEATAAQLPTVIDVRVDPDETAAVVRKRAEVLRDKIAGPA